MFNFFKHIPSLSAKEAAEKAQKATATLVDVRTREEYGEGHAQGAINIPLGDLEDRTSELKGQGEVYIICRSGGRSATAVEYLRAEGVNAINVSGGTIAWQSAGLPME